MLSTYATLPVLLLAVSAGLAAGADLDRSLLRLAEEAEVFQRMAVKVIGQETLEQIAMQPLPRFRARGARIDPQYKTRRIVSEYTFTHFKDDPEALHELRQVLQIDARPVKKPGALRETLSMNLKGDSDRLKKKLLKEWEAYGLREAATDFGQLVLLFTKRQQAGYDFSFVRNGQLGADKVTIVRYEQKESGPAAMTVFEGKMVVRHKLRGEVWLREPDGLPLRITLEASRADEKAELQHKAVVDYMPSAYGLVLPVSVTYAEKVSGLLLVENRFRYSDYKMFGSTTELKFTVEDEPKK
jgi:hypothetical protein